MGNSVQTLATNVSFIASENTWIEGLAIQQLLNTAALADMVSVAGMPDLHPGRGYPVGAAFFTAGRIYPALIGNDIGCGMGLWQTTAKLSKVNIDKLAKRLHSVEQPLGADWQSEIADAQAQRGLQATAFDASLGTIGGGNHFAEFQAVDKVFLANEFTQLGLDTQHLQLLVHSGSRGLGQAILTEHIQAFNHAGIAEEQAGFNAYLARHDSAVRWAELNRVLIARRFMAAIRESGNCVLDVNHNLVVPATIKGVDGWLHRKGATPADCGYVVIPGSRGDYSYLVKPLLNSATYGEGSLRSLAHGAGRKWKRGDCHGRLSHKYKRDDLYRTALGSRVICGNKELLYDEAPQAYKKCESVIDDLVDAGLLAVVARLKPVLTFKTHGDCSA